MRTGAVLQEMLKRRKLGVALVLVGLAFILLFATGLFLAAGAYGPDASCRKSPLLTGKTRGAILSCMAESAQGQERGLLFVPVSIAGGALVAAGAGVLLFPLTLSVPQRARDASWEAFAPRSELDLGPALYR